MGPRSHRRRGVGRLPGAVVSGDAAFTVAMTVAAVAGCALVAGLSLRAALRRWWVRRSGCPACAYRDRGECACPRECVNPECKGGAR